uniref:Uncharacterized protein n=1 Tax=Cacopsylla melanoneura TaxID=428564 RepID=A0A8D8PNS7_9HEMI
MDKYGNFYTTQKKKLRIFFFFFLQSISETYKRNSYRHFKWKHIINKNRVKQIMFRYFIRISWTHFDHLIRSKTTRNSEILFWMTQNNQNQTTKGTTRTTKLNATNQVEDSTNKHSVARPEYWSS